MEDWEKFFVEKSRRRFEKERAGRRRRRNQALISALVIGTAMAGAIAALSIFR